jgi:hypothetical protein
MGKKTVGYAFFILSCIMWVVPIVSGFLSFSAETLAVIITISVIAAEVFFFTALFLLGKAFWTKVKKYIRVYWKLCMRQTNRIWMDYRN